jgi:hypothetical protein
VNTWKVILATLVIFGTGVLTGGLLVTYSNSVLRPVHPPAAPDGPRRNPDAVAPQARRDSRLPPPPNLVLRREFLARLTRELELTREQRRDIEKIISEGQERTRELWQRVEPQVRAELARTRQKIRAELTPEQRARFQELLKQRPHELRGVSPPPNNRPHPPAPPANPTPPDAGPANP